MSIYGKRSLLDILDELDDITLDFDGYVNDLSSEARKICIDILNYLIDDCIDDYEKQTDNPMMLGMSGYTKHKNIIEKITGLEIKEAIKKATNSCYMNKEVIR